MEISSEGGKVAMEKSAEFVIDGNVLLSPFKKKLKSQVFSN